MLLLRALVRTVRSGRAADVLPRPGVHTVASSLHLAVGVSRVAPAPMPLLLQRPAAAGLLRAGAGGTQHHWLATVGSDDAAGGGGAGADAEGVRRDSLLMRLAPAPAVPYLELLRADKPIGTYLLMWPGFWSIALAAPPGTLPDARLLAVFAAGAWVMRGAGCVVNDLWDERIDRMVARTRARPLAAGTVTRRQAYSLLLGQLGVGFALLLTLNPASVVLGASSLGLVAIYPGLKRVTHWPQVGLGLAFNWGALLGWCAVHGDVLWQVVLPLYAAGVSWTLVYDTVYAHQDKRDDAVVGVGSTALRFGDKSRLWLGGFSAAMVGNLAVVGTVMSLPSAYWLGVGGVAAHLSWQLATVDFEDAKDCGDKFRSNAALGGVLFAAIVAAKLQLGT